MVAKTNFHTVGAAQSQRRCRFLQGLFHPLTDLLHCILGMNVPVDQGISCAGLLATSGTVQTGIYQRTCAEYGVSLLVPNDTEQQAVMDIIYRGVKAGLTSYDTAAVEQAVARLLAGGAQTMILGCTELPLAVKLYHMDFPAIDPTLELAKGAILAAGGTLI